MVREIELAAARRRANCWCGSPPQGCAIPTSRSSTARGRARCPWCWAMRRRASSRSCGRRHDGLRARRPGRVRFVPMLRRRACPAPKGGRRCASPGPPRTPQARCWAAAGAGAMCRKDQRQSSSRRLGICRAHRGQRTIRGEDRSGTAGRDCRPVRLCGHDGSGRRGEYRARAARAPVAVFGLGGVGLAACWARSRSGAFPIVAVDPVEDKLDLALSLGATHARAGEETVRWRAVRDTRVARPSCSNRSAARRCWRRPMRPRAAAGPRSPPACRIPAASSRAGRQPGGGGTHG